MIDLKQIERKVMLAMLRVENKFAEVEKMFEEMQNAGTNTQENNLPVQGDGQPSNPGQSV